MCFRRVVFERHLRFINGVAIVLDLAFFVVSMWTFSVIADALRSVVQWYLLLLSFSLPIIISVYSFGERIVRRDCFPRAATENAVAHAYGRARHALIAAYYNSFGINALIFWAPFYINAIDSPAQLLPDLIWQRLLTIPCTLAFCIIYTIVVAWNLFMQRIYASIAQNALRVLLAAEEESVDGVQLMTTRSQKVTNEARESGDRFYVQLML
jgi:hypothetical protein